MRILFIGNFTVSYSSESHYLKTLQKLGHQVTCIQENRTSAQEILSHINDADVLMHVHTHGPAWTIVGLKDVYAQFKARGIPTFGYHLDLWLGIEREKDLYNDEYWSIEYFFCTDLLMVNKLNETEGMPKAFFVRAGVFEDECFIGNFRPEFAKDIIFVGSKGYHSEWPYRSLLIDKLKQRYGDRFTHMGGDSGTGPIRGNDLNDLYRSSKIVIGDTLCKNFDYPQYLSDRVFETAGRGGFQIFPYIKGLEECFELGKEIVVYRFNNFDDNIMGLFGVIDYYLEHEEERKRIQMAGFERTKKDHTYTSRLKQIFEILENEKGRNG